VKEKLKKILWFFANPRLLLCVGLAWIITNGWSYILLGLGTIFQINWMIAVSSAYLAFLWFPFTPEKIVTFIIAIFLLKVLFPKDQKTLGILTDLYNKAKSAIKKRKKQDNVDKDVKTDEDNIKSDNSNNDNWVYSILL